MGYKVDISIIASIGFVSLYALIMIIWAKIWLKRDNENWKNSRPSVPFQEVNKRILINEEIKIEYERLKREKMAGCISKQPNELYCRFSSVVDCFTHINMSVGDYANYIEDRDGLKPARALLDALDIIENYLQPFNEVVERFVPNNISQAKHDSLVEKMNDTKGSYEEVQS